MPRLRRPTRSAEHTRDYLASLPAGQFPNLVALADHFAISDQDLRFEVLINLFVDGLACRIALERGSSPSLSSMMPKCRLSQIVN